MSVRPFSELDRELPLALLPVRLETRYLPRGAPTMLVVRIFPDELHADGYQPALTKREIQSGQTYWRAVWEETDTVAITAAREWLAGQCGPYRALWIATATTPTGSSATGVPQFPEVDVRLADRPTRARLLPDQWMVRLYDAQLQLVHTEFTNRVADGLAMAPALAAVDLEKVDPATGATRDVLDAFLGDQGLDWMLDVQRAVDVGMAVRIPIGNVPNPVGAVLVTGVRANRDPLAEAAELDALFAGHWYTRGFDVVPQGTPTNNTDAGRSPVSVATPDVDELFERETSERPMAPGGRTLLMAADPALMYRVPAADALSLALGRLRANTLDRTAHAETLDGLAAWAMSLAIGYVTFGDYLDGPLAKVDGRTVASASIPLLRDWYVDWVRGAGPLPVIRCGAQPYGVLPITTAPAVDAAAADFRAQLDHYLARFVASWRRSLPTAALDPDATDARPSLTPAADAVAVGEVLGAVPHPMPLQLRVGTDNTDMDRALLVRITGEINFDITRDQGGIVWAEMVGTWKLAKPTIDGIPTPEVPDATVPDIHTQLANAESFRAELAAVVDEINYGPEALAHIDDELLPLLEMHRDATLRVPPPLAEWNESGGIGSNDVIRLVHTTFDPVAEPVEHLVTTAGDLTELDTLLGAVITALDETIEQQLDHWSRDGVVGGPAPLLHHLLDQNQLQVPLADAARVRLAVQVLRAGVANGELTEAVVDRVLRETLGLGEHRLDAWMTSLASERLAAKRRQRPAGIQIGGYGWLLDLEPAEEPATQGFIHASSLSHAATAAVLRSGWSAFGTSSGETPLSIDLRSIRARGGQWLLDGVRNGQDLAETLGARFERFLHDLHLDTWIESVRQVVLDVLGTAGPASAVVDGLLVARSASDMDRTPTEDRLRSAILAATAPTGDPGIDAQRAAVRGQWHRLAADLDSAADLTMAQSVHSLLRGNLDAAAGALALTGGVDAAVPPITVTAGPRDSQLVSHRVVAVWPVDEPANAAMSVLDTAEPRLAAWLADLLPAADNVAASLVVRDAGGTIVERGTITLAEVGLTAVEAAHLAGTGSSQIGARLGRIVTTIAAERAVDGGTVELDLARPPRPGALSVDEFGLLAAVAIDAVGRARPLRAPDLVVPGADPGAPTEDDGELRIRLLAAEGRLDAIGADLASADPARVRSALLRCAAIDVPGAVPALEAGATAEAASSVTAALADRRTSAAAAEAETSGSAAEVVTEHLRRLLNGALPILPVFTPPPDPDRAPSAAFARRQAEVAASGHRWLRQAGRVRSSLGAATELLLLGESVLGRIRARLGLVQLPHHDEGWAAIGPIEGRRERLAILSLTGVDALAAESQPIAGLLVDGWTEGIPRSDQLTGIATHFDAPTARAPNAVLLSVVDDERGFSAGEISEQLLHTVQLAKLRAIPPTGLVEHGHYIPMVFLPEDIELPAAVAQ